MKKELVVKELQEYLDTLEEYYGVKPIIYTTLRTYMKYFKDSFLDYPLWIGNVYYHPSITLSRKWTFWQYSDDSKMEVYKGNEMNIDMNVFCGSLEKLHMLTLD